MIRCPYYSSRRIPRDCRTCTSYDKKRGCLKTAHTKKKPQEVTA